MERNYSFKKIRRNALIVGGLGLASFLGYNSFIEEDNSIYAEDRINRPYSFDGFGHIIEEKFNNETNNVTSVCSADIDGDGDNDIIVGLEQGRVIIYENKFPQVNK